ncbi:hypothetical protein IO967_004851, partial [Escherichia coli]|nr:hypothetical protein [Escherichia coli]EHK6188603.1 hypothetical protein [Escherichia coli]
LNINIMVNNCIKLIMRPASLENIKDASYGDKLRWSINNGKLTVENPTPYYINFSEIKLNGKNITPPVFVKEGANKRGNSSRLTQSFHFFMFEPIFSPVNALNQPI